MAEIHPHVQSLLSLLLEGPAAPLALTALAYIQSDDDPEDAFDKERFGRDESPRGRGLRQLSVADRIVVDVLKREVALCERLRGIAGEFEIYEVIVTSPTLDLRGEVGIPDRLLSQERNTAIAQLLEAWRIAVDETRQTLESDFGE